MVKTLSLSALGVSFGEKSMRYQASLVEGEYGVVSARSEHGRAGASARVQTAGSADGHK